MRSGMSRRKYLLFGALALFSGLSSSFYLLDIRTAPSLPSVSSAQQYIAEKWQHFAAFPYSAMQRPFQLSNYLSNATDGPSELSFRSKLLPDLRYATTFYVAGFNNQFISLFNFLDLLFLLRSSPYPTYYVPILPPFHPAHIDTSESLEFLPVSTVFDIKRYERETGMPLLEWGDVKTLRGRSKGREYEPLGCWSSWAASFAHREPGDRISEGYNFLRTATMEHLSLDLQYTQLPDTVVSPISKWPRPTHLAFLADWLSPAIDEGNNVVSDYLHNPRDLQAAKVASAYNQTIQQMRGEKWIAPEMGKGELMCFDNLYYAGDSGTLAQPELSVPDAYIDSGPGVGGAFLGAGRFLYWSETVLTRTATALLAILDLPSGSGTLPPYIAMHIRRTDFLPRCHGKPCFTVESFARHLNGLIEAEPTLEGLPVVVTTDETDEEYHKEIAMRGWKLLNHQTLQTEEVYGPWWPTLIDSCLLSSGKALVGTAGSTMTGMAGLRLKVWNGGKTVAVGPFD